MARSDLEWRYHKGYYRCPYCNKLVNKDYARLASDMFIRSRRLICPGCWKPAKIQL